MQTRPLSLPDLPRDVLLDILRRVPLQNVAAVCRALRRFCRDNATGLTLTSALDARKDAPFLASLAGCPRLVRLDASAVAGRFTDALEASRDDECARRMKAARRRPLWHALATHAVDAARAALGKARRGQSGDVALPLRATLRSGFPSQLRCMSVSLGWPVDLLPPGLECLRITRPGGGSARWPDTAGLRRYVDAALAAAAPVVVTLAVPVRLSELAGVLGSPSWAAVRFVDVEVASDGLARGAASSQFAELETADVVSGGAATAPRSPGGLQRLQRLRLGCVDAAQERAVVGLLPPQLPRLRDLELHGCDGVTALGLCALDSAPALSRLHLQNCSGVERLARSLRRSFPALQSLELRDCSRLQELAFSVDASFPALTRLRICRCQRLMRLGDSVAASLPKLALLVLTDCTGLHALARAIHASFPALESLSLHGCSALTCLAESVSASFAALDQLACLTCRQLTGLALSVSESFGSLSYLQFGSRAPPRLRRFACIAPAVGSSFRALRHLTLPSCCDGPQLLAALTCCPLPALTSLEIVRSPCISCEAPLEAPSGNAPHSATALCARMSGLRGAPTPARGAHMSLSAVDADAQAPSALEDAAWRESLDEALPALQRVTVACGSHEVHFASVAAVVAAYAGLASVGPSRL